MLRRRRAGRGNRREPTLAPLWFAVVFVLLAMIVLWILTYPAPVPR